MKRHSVRTCQAGGRTMQLGAEGSETVARLYERLMDGRKKMSMRILVSWLRGGSMTVRVATELQLLLCQICPRHLYIILAPRKVQNHLRPIKPMICSSS